MKTLNAIFIIPFSMIILNINFIYNENSNNGLREFLKSRGINHHGDNDGYDKFKLTTWYPAMTHLSSKHVVKCDEYLDILTNTTVSFAIMMNRLYQFITTESHNFFGKPMQKIDVIMYDQMNNRYDNKLKRLNLIDGRMISIDEILPEFNGLGNFQRRLTDIFRGYPETRAERLTTGLIWEKSKGFTYLHRLMLCCNRFWLVCEYHSSIDGSTMNNNYYYDYHSLKPTQSYHLIPISFGDRIINIVHDSSNTDSLVWLLDFNLTMHQSTLCYGQHSTQMLRTINDLDQCTYSQSYETMSSSLVSLIEKFNYGFKLYDQLLLISKRKRLVLIVDEKLIHTRNKEYRYIIKSYNDFFYCDQIKN